MGNRKFGILVLMLFLFGAISVIAVDFTADIVPVKDKISSDESAVFNLTTKNYKAEDRFTLLSKDPRWSLLTKPLTHFTSGILIENGSTEKTIVYLTPVDLPVGKYKVGLELTSRNTGKIEELVLDVTIGSYMAGKPVVDIGLELIPAVTLPGNKISVNINLENKNNINLKNLSLEIVSGVINKKESFDLAAYEKKTLELTAEIDKTAKAQEYSIKAIIKKDSESLGEISAVLSVLKSLPDFKKEMITSTAFLKLVNELTVTNDGNARIIKTAKVPVGYIKRWFTSTEPEYNIIKEDGKRYLGWEVDLKPGESTRIAITSNYRPISFIIVFIAAIILAYFMIRPSIKANKTAIKALKKEGGIGELNILLNVKNRRNKVIQDVRVEDSIPKISELVKEEYVGTLAPSSVFKHETKGTVLRWDIGNLEPKEERLFRYRLKSRISILGSFYLPKIKVKYKEDEKTFIIYSRKKKIVG